jgi:hypothetical protein
MLPTSMRPDHPMPTLTIVRGIYVPQQTPDIGEFGCIAADVWQPMTILKSQVYVSFPTTVSTWKLSPLPCRSDDV